MPLGLFFLISLILSYLPLSLSYRDGARSESCYNMLVMHTNFIGQTVSPSECSNPCPYDLRVVGRLNAENTLNPMETTYQFGEVYHCKWAVYRVQMCLFMFVFSLFIHIYFLPTVQLTSTMGSAFEGFMVEARESTEAFDNGSTIWGAWVTDLGSGFDPSMNLLYHTVECNRSLTSSEETLGVSHETN